MKFYLPVMKGKRCTRQKTINNINRVFLTLCVFLTYLILVVFCCVLQDKKLPFSIFFWRCQDCQKTIKVIEILRALIG